MTLPATQLSVTLLRRISANGPLTQLCNFSDSNNYEHCHRISLPQMRSYSINAIRNYYDTLEITPKATKKQVKSAYYRLSKKYHPDMNTEPDSKLRFSEISEAYEVLSNPKSRRLYDRGFFSPNSGQHNGGIDIEYEDYIKKTGHFGKKRASPMTGKTKIYDFDEFYRAHYEDSVRQAQDRQQAKQKYHEDVEEDKMHRAISLFICTFFGTLSIFFILKRKI